MSTIDGKIASDVCESLVGGREDVEAMAVALALRAAKLGLILTIETKPQVPFAMGNYGLDVQTRPARYPLPSPEPAPRIVRRWPSHGKTA